MKVTSNQRGNLVEKNRYGTRVGFLFDGGRLFFYLSEGGSTRWSDSNQTREGPGCTSLHSNHQTNYIIHKIISKFRILWATIDIPQRSIAPEEELSKRKLFRLKTMFNLIMKQKRSPLITLISLVRWKVNTRNRWPKSQGWVQNSFGPITLCHQDKVMGFYVMMVHYLCLVVYFFRSARTS